MPCLLLPSRTKTKVLPSPTFITPTAAYTVQRFEAVKTLHIILLVISLCIIALFVVFLFRWDPP